MRVGNESSEMVDSGAGVLETVAENEVIGTTTAADIEHIMNWQPVVFDNAGAMTPETAAEELARFRMRAGVSSAGLSQTCKQLLSSGRHVSGLSRRLQVVATRPVYGVNGEQHRPLGLPSRR